MVLGIVDVGELLVAIVVNEVGRRLQVIAELQARVRAQTTAAHARVVAQPSLVQVAVLQRPLGRHPLVRVPREQLQQQLARVLLLGDLREQRQVARLEGAAAVGDVAASGVARAAHLLRRRRAEDVADLVDLLERVGRQEHDLSVEQLAVDAADAPHVDREVVVFGAEEEFGRAVVLGDDLLN